MAAFATFLAFEAEEEEKGGKAQTFRDGAKNGAREESPSPDPLVPKRKLPIVKRIGCCARKRKLPRPNTSFAGYRLERFSPFRARGENERERRSRKSIRWIPSCFLILSALDLGSGKSYAARRGEREIRTNTHIPTHTLGHRQALSRINNSCANSQCL